MLDSPEDILPAAMNYLGLNPNSKAPADLEKGAALLAKVRPSVLQVSLVGISERAGDRRNLPRGRLVRRHQAGAGARRRGQGSEHVEIGYAIPKGGAQMWFDNLAIPRDASNVDEAHAFIDFLMRPEVAAQQHRRTSPIPNGNLASQKLIDREVLDDRTIYPDEETMKGLYTISANDQQTQRLINRLWTRVKTGR